MSETQSRAQAAAGNHVFSTFFPARTVESELASDAGLEAAVAWCQRHGITKVYLESFRDGLQASVRNLTKARERFRAAGIETSGGITTTGMVKPSERGWGSLPCFTDEGTQRQLEEIFSYIAPLFDEIMIDDFFATGCRCQACEQARGHRSWADYRIDLMCRLSRDRVLDPVHRINPAAKVIIKFPMWYDEFQERGYDPDRQTQLFDLIWVGTECRDMGDNQWGGAATYRPFWLMRWLGQIGGRKCGGGWYDPFGTHEDTYLEQARQTILGGAQETVLFCYPHLVSGQGQRNVDALCREMPRLMELAAWVSGEPIRGVVSYKPIGSPPAGDDYVFDWLGMVGIPVIPDHLFPASAGCALFSAHGAADAEFASRVRNFLNRGGRAILTPRAAAATGTAGTGDGAYVLDFSEPQQIMELPQSTLAALRRAALAPLGLGFEGPAGVALYLFGERKVVLESFLNVPVEVRLLADDASSYRVALVLGADATRIASDSRGLTVRLPVRGLVALER